MKIEELGFIDKGTGKHQSNIVYSAGGGIAPTLTATLGVKNALMIIDMVCVTSTHTASMQTTQKELASSNS